MRKATTVLAIVAMATAIGLVPVVSAGHSNWSDSRTVVSPNPRILAFGWGDCDPDSDMAQNTDGLTQVNYDITAIDEIWPEVVDEPHVAVLESDPTVYTGLFMYKYNETNDQCHQVAREDPDLIDPTTTVREGIPSDTEFIQVRVWGGAGQYTLSLEAGGCQSPFC